MNATKGKRAPTEYAPYQLRVIMAKVGVSGRELARLIGVSPNWVSLRTTGQATITPDDAVAICEGLGVGLADMAAIPPPSASRRYASVLVDTQDFIDDRRTTSAMQQRLLRRLRFELNMALEERDGIPRERKV